MSVEAYDSEPPDKTENNSLPEAGEQADVWHGFRDVGEFEWDARGLARQVLFLCWPPGWGSPMAAEALAEFERIGGERLIFVGQPKGGTTVNDAFFDALSANWVMESEDERFVSWWNLLDVAQAWVRR